MATRGPKPVGVVFTEDNVKMFPPRPAPYRDAVAKGLILRVSKTGTRSYAYESRNASNGKNNKPLGFVGDDKLEDVRFAAMGAKKELAVNARIETSKAAGDRFPEVLKLYSDDNGIRPQNARKYEFTLETYGFPFWDKPLADITRVEVQKHRNAILNGRFTKPPGSKAEGGPRAANKFIQYASMVSTFALGKFNMHAFRGHDLGARQN